MQIYRSDTRLEDGTYGGSSLMVALSIQHLGWTRPLCADSTQSAALNVPSVMLKGPESYCARNTRRQG
jgi:hypothetical protein